MANVFRDHGIERRLALSASYLRNLVFRLSGQDCVDIRLGRSRSKSIAVLFRPGLYSTTCPSAIQHRAARKPTSTLISEFHDMFEVFKKGNRYLDNENIDHGVSAIFPSSGAPEEATGTFKFLWGGDFANVGETLSFLTKPEANATWLEITESTYSCDTFDRGYYFQRYH